MTVKTNYYIGEGPEAVALIEEVARIRKANRRACAVLQHVYGADGLLNCGFLSPEMFRGMCACERDDNILSWDECRKICGLVFNRRQHKSFLKDEVKLENGFGYYADENCDQGRELACDLRELHFTIWEYIIQSLQLNRICVGANYSGEATYCSVAGYVGNKIVVSMPDGENCTPMPEVPAWFRQVEKAEWLCIACNLQYPRRKSHV